MTHEVRGNMDDVDVEEREEGRSARGFHSRLAKIREKMFRNEEAGLSLEGFLDALSAGQDDLDTVTASSTSSKFATPVRSTTFAPLVGSPATGLAVKDADARIKSDLAEYRSLMVNRSDFEEVSVLGHGHFATVSMVREKVAVHGNGGKVYAMKKMAKATMAPATARLERTIMSKAKSDWIVKLRFAFQDSRFLYLVMEYCPGGDLRNLLDRHDGKFSESMTRFYMAEMILAIHTLHLMGYVHRDIKPENVLLDRFGHIKLADFGSAQLITSKSKEDKPVGTPNYVSPEILQCLDTNRTEDHDPRKSDYWSLGVVGFEMITGKTPFADDKKSIASTYANIMSNNYTKAMSQLDGDLKDMMQGLLTDVEKRFGYEQLVRHEFFISVDWDGLCSSCAPFVPEIKDCFDTSNFDLEGRQGSSLPNHCALNAAAKVCDPVVGFSYAGKHSESVRYSRQFGGDDYSDMVSSLRRQNEDLRLKVSKLEKEKTKERRESAAKLALEVDRRGQEEAKALKATVKELERLLDVEREERKLTETKSLELLTEVRKKWESREEARVSKFELELKKAQKQKELMEQDLKSALELAEIQKAEIKELRDIKGQLKVKLKECKSKLEVTFGKFEEESQKVKDLKEQSFLLAEANNRSAELEKTALCKELSDERSTVHELRRNLESVKKDLEKARSVDRDQKETLQFLREEKEVWQTEHETALKSMTKEKDGLKQDKEKLQLKLAHLEGECEMASIKMKDKDNKLEELGRVLEKLESKINPIDRLPPQSKSDCDCKEEVKALKDELKRVRSSQKEAEDELSTKKVDVRLLERKNKELEERIKWRVEMARDEKAERQKLEEESKEATTKAKKLEKEMEKAKADAERVGQRIPNLEEEIRDLRKTVATLRLKEDQANQAERRLEATEKKLSSVEAIAKKCGELELANAHLKASCLELQDQCTEYETVLEKIEATLKSERAARDRYQSDAAEQGKAASELRIERNELKSRLAFTESQIRELRAKNDDVEAAFRREEAEWGERLTKAAGTRSEQETALRRMRDQLDHLVREGERSGEEAVALREHNLQLKEEAAELTTGMHSLKESNLKLNSVVEESLRKIERRNAEIARMQDQILLLREEKERRENEHFVHIEQLKKLIDHLRGKNGALELQLFGGKKSGKKRPAETKQLPVPDDELLLRTPVGRSRSPAKTPRNTSRSPIKSPPRKAFK